MLLLKLDPQGALLWQRTYTAADVADARGGVTVAPDGTVAVAGCIQATTRRTAVNETFVAKFGSDGSLIWDRGFGGDQGDFPGGIATRSDGTILVGGETGSFGAGSDDAFLLQLDRTGKGVACNTWGGAGLDHGDDVELAPGGTDRARRDDGEPFACHVRHMFAAGQAAEEHRGRAGCPAGGCNRSGRRPERHGCDARRDFAGRRRVRRRAREDRSIEMA
jgi:hypothetical protein